MSLYDAKARLGHAAQRLQLRWLDTQAEWTDGKSRELEDDYLTPLASHVTTAVSAIDRLAEVIARAERECR